MCIFPCCYRTHSYAWEQPLTKSLPSRWVSPILPPWSLSTHNRNILVNSLTLPCPPYLMSIYTEDGRVGSREFVIWGGLRQLLDKYPLFREEPVLLKNKKTKNKKQMTVPRKDLLCCWLPRSHQPSEWKYDKIVTYAHFQEFKTSLANFEKKALAFIVKRKKISSLSPPWAKGEGGLVFCRFPCRLLSLLRFLFFFF